MAEPEHGKLMLWTSIIAAVATVVAIGFSIFQWKSESDQNKEANQIALSESLGNFNISMELRQYDTSKREYFDTSLSRERALNRSEVVDTTWIKIALINTSSTPLSISDIGIITDSDRNLGFWEKSLNDQGVDCSDNQDIRCSDFPVALPSGEKYVTFWPLSDTIDALLKEQPGHSIVIGVSASPTKLGTYLFNTGLVVS